MMHGLCGNLNLSSPCMKNGKCSKNYPCNFNSVTIVNKNGYPVYHRRNPGYSVIKSVKILNNRWVVPYNPYFSLKYNCHINVEICSSIKSVKYLYKYVYKDSDRVIVSVENNSNNNFDNQNNQNNNQNNHQNN